LASRTLWIGFAGFALIQIIGRFVPIPSLLFWSLVPLVLWLLAMVGFWLFRPLPIDQVARRVDAHLELRERLSTALELQNRSADSQLEAQQQADAQSHADGLRPTMLPLSFQRQPLMFAALPLVLGVVLAFLPNPQDAVLREQAALQEVLAQTADQIEQLQQQLAQDQTLSPEEL